MAEAIGFLIVEAVAVTGYAEGLVAFAEATYLGVSGATFIGAGVLLGASIGLQYALSNPNVPKPEAGSIPIKQALSPRKRAYWVNRLSGTYMLFIAAGGDSQDVLAMHQGRIEEILSVYLHDDVVELVPSPAHGVIGRVVAQGEDFERYADNCVQIEFWYGEDGQSFYGGLLDSTGTGGEWTSAHVGNGVAGINMFCTKAADPEEFTKKYPHGLPLPSLLGKFTPIWDPRDLSQSRADPSTWRARPNPVLQLIDYLTEPDGGMGLDIDDILPPAALAQWMAQANICDAMYQSAGFYNLDNAPENVVNKILATCDGFLTEDGEGSLALQVGYYNEPTDPPITADHVLEFDVRYGVGDEESVNQIDIVITDPDAGYVSNQLDSIRDEAAITAAGIVRPRQLDLTWVQSREQAYRLGQRAMLRANPVTSGTLVTSLYGMRYIGKRWIKLQVDFPGLEDIVIEVQDRAKIDILGGTVTFIWQSVDVAILQSLQPISLDFKLDFGLNINSQYLALFEDI